MGKARYIMIGGFLGAGKTTAILRLAERLHAAGSQVGLITNDQSYGLVDTTMLGAHGFPVEEITGGCFCCRFNSLVQAADRLSEAGRPDVFLAEPVGSCTDLKATVDYPLRRLYGDDYAIAPLSVLVDPIRALRILGMESGKSFSAKVVYIYLKQLEEADLIVVNKTDLIDVSRVELLMEALRERFPRAEVLPLSARSGIGLDHWLQRLDASSSRIAGAMEVDYDTYAEGEALLGWLNTTLRFQAGTPIDGNRMLLELCRDLQLRLERAGVEIAHLKLTLNPDDDGQDLGVVNAVRSDRPAEAAYCLKEPLDSGELILNLRAEADPEMLRDLVLATLAAARERDALELNVVHLERFRPGRPVPTHRLVGA